MKVQCPRCREIIEMERFSTSDEGLRFSCTECRESNFLTNPKFPSIQDPVEFDPAMEPSFSLEEDNLCPKCGFEKIDPNTCHGCGLEFSSPVLETLQPPPVEAETLWRQILQEPDDLERHERFVLTCNHHDRLEYATRQYRILSRDPELTEVVMEMKERILHLAQTQIDAMDLDAAPGARLSKTTRSFLWIVSLAGMLAGLGWLFSGMVKSLSP